MASTKLDSAELKDIHTSSQQLIQAWVLRQIKIFCVLNHIYAIRYSAAVIYYFILYYPKHKN